MAYYAYSDFERKKIVLASSCTIIDKHKEFYCENPECNAKLKLKALNSNIVNKYFSTLKNFPHIENCYFKKITTNNFNEIDYNEDLFIFNDIIEEYLNNNICNVNRRLSTLSQIYYMCKSKDIFTKYNDFQIGKILCDTRSNHIYIKGIFGYRLIECKFYSYRDQDKTLYFKYPLNDSLINTFLLKIVFQTEELYLNIKNTFCNFKGYPIVIAGQWYKNEKYFSTNITNRNQFYAP